MQTGTLAGKPAVALAVANNRLVVPAAIRPDEWTIWFALSATAASSAISLMRSDAGNAVDYGPNIYIAAGGPLRLGRTTSLSVGDVRLDGGAVPAGVPVFYMLTLSAENGLAIWRNGSRIAHAPADTTPFAAGNGASQWVWARSEGTGGTTRMGWMGHCNEDITKARYSADGTAGHAARLWAFMKAEYGIV